MAINYRADFDEQCNSLLCPKFYIDSCLLREHPDGHDTSEETDL